MFLLLNLRIKFLATSGVHPVASYYSGRGVNLGDLSDSHLVSIFKKLLKYDVTLCL